MTNANRRGDRPQRVEGKRFRWAVIALVIVASLCVAIAYAISDRVRDQVLNALVQQIDAQIPGSVHAEHFGGSFVRRFSIHGIEITDSDETLLEIESVTVEMDWLALVWGRLGIANVDIEKPRGRMREGPDGTWDLLQALSPEASGGAPENPRPLILPIWVDAVTLRSGAIRIVPAAGGPIDVEGLSLDASGNAHGRVLEATLKGLHAEVNRSNWPQIVIEAGGMAERKGLRRRIVIDRLDLATSDSRVSTQGEVQIQESLDITMKAEPVAKRDFARFAPNLESLPDTTGQMRVSGEWSALRFEGFLDWMTARLEVEGLADANQLAALPTTASLRFDAPDLGQWIEGRDLGGHAEVRATLEDGQARFESVWGHDGGQLEVNGDIKDFIGAQASPRLDLDLVARRLDLAKLFPARPELSSELSGTASAHGGGRVLADLDLTAAVDLAESRVGSLDIDRAGASLRFENRGLTLSGVEVVSSVGIVSMAGNLSTETDGPVDIQGRIEVEDLGPLFALNDRQGHGALQGEFRLDGKIDHAHAVAAMRIDGLAVDDNRFEHATVLLDIDQLPSLPIEGTARIEIENLSTPWYEGNLRLDATGTGSETQAFSVSLDAADRQQHQQHVTLQGRFEKHKIQGVLQEASFQLAGRSWALGEATGFEASSTFLSMESLRLRSGEASIEANGILRRVGEQRFELRSRALRIETLVDQIWHDRDLDLGGSLDLDLRITGTAEAPLLDIEVETNALAIEEQTIEALEGRIGFASGSFDVDLSMQQAANRRMKVKGTLPAEFEWAKQFVLRANGDLDLRVVADPFDIDFLSPFVEDHVHELAGRAGFDLHVTGPLDRPQPIGRVLLENVHFLPRATQIPIDDLRIEITVDRTTATLDRLTAKAGEGTLAGAGELRFGARSIESFSATLDLDRWPLISTKSYHLVSSGSLQALGRSKVFALSGGIDIVEGTLRPDLAFLMQPSPDRDPTIVFEEDETSPTDSDPLPTSVPTDEAASFDQLALDLQVRVERDLWIRHEQAALELRGDVTARKSAGGALTLDGRVATHTGWINLQGRRFKLVEGALEFAGGSEIDPSIGVLARYRVPAYTIDARVGGTAKLPTLELSSDPQLEEDDILAVLLFGRPTSDLDDNEKVTLADRSSSLASSYGLTAAGRSLARAVGLEEAGLQINELSQERASVGAYVGRRTFVSVAQDFGAEYGQQFSIEYEFWPGWSIVTSTNSEGTNSADLLWKIRY